MHVRPRFAAVLGLAVPVAALAGCGNGSHDSVVADLAPVHDLADAATAPDLARPHIPDGGIFHLPDGGVFTKPNGGGNVSHGAPGQLAGARVIGRGHGFRDVSTDQGGGVWAVDTGRAYYFRNGADSAVTYDQSNGLAQGKTSWVDTWFNDPSTPTTLPVTFTAVGGGLPGQVVIGHIGYIADRMQVDPATGAVESIEAMKVTQIPGLGDEEYQAHLARVVSVWKVAVDLDGPWGGAAYAGGYHGVYAIHGMNGPCGCLVFEEHQHYAPGDKIGGTDVRAVAVDNNGDVWTGDRDYVTLMTLRSRGARANLLDRDVAVGLDVFPEVRDEIWGVGPDANGGVWVASHGNGLAYLAPGTFAPTYYSSADVLPEDYLTSLAVDRNGDVWIATQTDGVVRYTPGTHAWTYYTTASGLPSNDINAVYVDPHAGNARVVYIATANGIVVYDGP